MKLIDPALASLATAKNLLLDPWGLSEADMARAISEIFTHKVDYADLYFQYTRSEGWTLKKGLLKQEVFQSHKALAFVRSLEKKRRSRTRMRFHLTRCSRLRVPYEALRAKEQVRPRFIAVRC